MPLYGFVCTNDNCSRPFEAFCSIAERKDQKCIYCGSPAIQQISAPAVHIFKPGWWNDISTKPLWIESKKQLKEECEKHNCYAVGELD